MPAPIVRPKPAYRTVQPLVRLTLALLAALALPVLGMAQPERELRDQFVYDFRGRPLPAEMKRFGPQAQKFIASEPGGLRMTLPRDRASVEPVGLSMPLTIGGDFEITVAFEILEAEKPPPGKLTYGVGLMMSVNQAARVGRLVRAEDHVATWDCWTTVDGEPKWLNGTAPCKNSLGKLRLKRTKTILHMLWAPELAGDNFEELHQFEFGADGITLLKLELNSEVGGESVPLDVRLFDLKIRASTPIADPAVAANKDFAGGTNVWLPGAGALLLAILLAIVLSLVFRRRRRNSSMLALDSAAAAEDQHDAAATSVAFACSDCGKRLKARAQLASKAIKCPQCGAAQVVPRSGSQEGQP